MARRQKAGALNKALFRVRGIVPHLTAFKRLVKENMNILAIDNKTFYELRVKGLVEASMPGNRIYERGEKPSCFVYFTTPNDDEPPFELLAVPRTRGGDPLRRFCSAQIRPCSPHTRG